ncbi:unnamed protein product [Didymodactylos carnosus]|uniref:FLYWCH-type domain-containing protein n=1 Tax=Didymodactylos carnosus TaxID=1234261 RepID=A0A814NY08_9BILA|nr:unnamed protein product [Didymodactylos carnosus]CAF3864754.1 unnamed protein product [Didymodactylos carnosus]
MSANFVESTHGKRQLNHLGYRYCFKRKNQSSEYWVCVQCKATATTYLDLSVVVRDDHTHLPDDTCAKILEIRKSLQHKSTAEAGLIDRIVEEAYNKANRQSSCTDLLINLPPLYK